MLYVFKNFKLCVIVILKNFVLFFKKKKKVFMLCSVFYKGVVFLCKKVLLYDGFQLRDVSFCDVLFCERMFYCIVVFVNLVLWFDRTIFIFCFLLIIIGICFFVCIRFFASVCIRFIFISLKSSSRRRSVVRIGRSRSLSFYVLKF